MNSNQRTTFLTGSTGFIGQYVLRGLLDCGHRVVVMLRGSQAAGGARLAGLMQPLGVNVDQHLRDGNLIIVEGSLPDGLPKADIDGVGCIVHCAACLQMANPDPGEPFATNVEGAKALARWAEVHEVPEFHFVSTAYTCGRDAKVVYERFHEPQPRFETDYELSKWLAEDYLRNWSQRTGHKLTVLRPGLVVGDSVTGYATQYGGFYQFARIIELLGQSFRAGQDGANLVLPMRIPGDPQGCQNLLSVDHVASKIVEIVDRPELSGRIYHLTNPHPPTNAQLKQWLEEYFQVCGGHFVDHLNGDASESAAEQMFLRSNSLILRQLSFVPQFDCTNTTAAITRTQIPCPAFDRSLAFRLIDYARAHRWGRDRQAAAS